MIRSFADKRTALLFRDEPVRGLSRELRSRALAKLFLVHRANRLEDLRLPAGNRLEKLQGDRGAQHSIRVNAQWRVCFRWLDGDAHDVELVDYH